MAKKAYPVIGGPLDGLHLKSDDFARGWGTPSAAYYQPSGVHAALKDEYQGYNSASGRLGHGPSMIWVHHSLLGRPARSAEPCLVASTRAGEDAFFTALTAKPDAERAADALLALGAASVYVTADDRGSRVVFSLACREREAALEEIAEALRDVGLERFSLQADG